MLNIPKISKTQMINLMRKIQTVSCDVESLDGFRVVVTTDMEVTRNFINENEATHFTSFLIFQCFNRVIQNLLRCLLSMLTFEVMFLSYVLSIHFLMFAIFDMLDAA